MRGGWAEATRLGTSPACLAAILAATCDNAGSSSHWWVTAFRPYPAALAAARMAATADAVISGRSGRLRPLRARARDGGSGSARAVPAGAGSGRDSIADWAAVTLASSSAAVGLRSGSLARHCSISGRTSAGAPSRSAASRTTRSSTVAGCPAPNGLRPVAAKASTAPRLNTSLSGPTPLPSACSGDMKLGVPTTRPARASGATSAAWEIPKSITRGPSSASSTLEGLRSPCTTPAAWIAVRLLTSPAASASTDAADSGPRSRTGPSLAEAVRDRGPLSAAPVLALAAGLVKSLTAIHAVGVVHGDLKPSNVLLALDGPRVIDFGISQAAEAAPLARGGLVVGTPSFMSPEQAAGQEVGPLSDVFSLGAVLAFAATGRKPFGTGQPAAVLDRVVHGAADLRDAPAEVRPLIEQCLAKDPLRRPTAAELLAGVTAAQSAMEPRPEPALRDPAGPDRRPGADRLAGPQAGGVRRRPRRTLITAAAAATILMASGAGYGLNAAAQHARDDQAPSQIAAGMAARPAGLGPRRVPSSSPPHITGTYTYQQGVTVVFEISYSDPGHNAAGFGFVGVQGSDWPRQHYSFSSPADGIVAGNSIAFPLDQGCGTGFEWTSTVKAWIYDKAGTRSKPVIIHLAC